MQLDLVSLHPASDYLAPAVSIVPFIPENLICESPIGGGNEGIGYENWG